MFSKGITNTKTHTPGLDHVEQFKRKHGLTPKIAIPENLNQTVAKILAKTGTSEYDTFIRTIR